MMTNEQMILLADAILIAHFMIAAFITFSLPVIWIGKLLGRKFVHNPWFRFTHLGLMGVVLSESFAGVLCPLTTWEADLRYAAGGGGNGDGQAFIAYWMGQLLFHDFSETAYTIAYTLFFLAVVATFIWVPIKKRSASPPSTDTPAAGGSFPAARG